MRPTWSRFVALILVVVGALAGAAQDAVSAPPMPGTNRSYLAYFYKPDEAASPLGAYLTPVVFPLDAAASAAEQVRLAFQALCEKPPKGLTSAIKQGCRVGSASAEGDGTLVVNFAQGEVFQPAGTTGDLMVVEQLAMTAAQFEGLRRVAVAFQGGVPRDLGSHGVGNPFPASGRSRMFLVTPPVQRGEKPETESLHPSSSAVRNATGTLSRPLLGVINQRLSELGRTENLAKLVEHIIPSGDGTIWVKVSDRPGQYQVWWNGNGWQVEGM